MMPGEGKTRLIRELKERGLEDLVRKAEQREYSDFASPHAFPVKMLVDDLVAAGQLDLAQRAMMGDFDHDD